MKDLLNKMTELQGSDTSTGKQVLTEATGVTDYNPKSQGGTRKELLTKYANSKDPKDAESARKAGATQTELKKAKDEVVESAKPSLKNIFNTMLSEAEQVDEKYMGFEKVKAAAKKGGAEDPGAVAASIGRKKYGKEKFQKAAAAGKKLSEAEQITIQPAKQNTQVIKQGQKTLGTVENPQLAAQIKQSIGKGEMTLAGDELQEDDLDEAHYGPKLDHRKGKYASVVLYNDYDIDPEVTYHDTLDDAIADGSNTSAHHNSAYEWNERKNKWIRKYSATEPPYSGSYAYGPSYMRESKLNEKAVSKSQQQAAGAALAAKRGDAPKSNLKGASKEMTKMSTKELEKFAKTKHKGLPEKKKTNESISSSVSDWFYVQGAKKIVNLLDSGENVMKLATMISTMDPKKQNDLVRGIEVYLSKYPHDKLQKLSDVLRVKTNEALEKDGPKSGDLNFNVPTGEKGKEYVANKAKQRSDMNKKNDPGAAKKGLALSVVDREKAANKAKKKTNEAALPTHDGDFGAGLGAGRSKTTLEAKAKPDYIDLDKDGNKKESMKKAAADKQKVSTMKKTTESKAKPDYIDLDKDGNKKEPMKKAAADAKKKVAVKEEDSSLSWSSTRTKKSSPALCTKHNKPLSKKGEGADAWRGCEDCPQPKTTKKTVKEGANPTEAARLLGKAHALAKDPFSCKYESGTAEAQAYLAGYKEGLDECYGSGSSDMGQDQMPAVIPGMDVMGMAPADNDFEEDVLVGKTTYGGDTDNFGFDDYEDEETMMAFESWDRQLNALLNEGKMKDIDLDMKELSDAQFKKDHGMTKSQMQKSLTSDDKKDKKTVKEGVTVAINKDIENAPDSVTVTAQGDEADQLLALIKQAGMGLFGGDDQQATGSYGAPVAADTNTPALGDVGDHDSMMALIQKMTAGAQDYADEESQDDEHVHGHPDAACDTCGSAACECDSAGTAMVVGEEETEDQMEFQVAEEADSEEAETTADEDAEAEEDKALAGADSKDEEEIDEEKELTEWANDANNQRTEDDSYYEDIEFMTKVISGGLNNQKQDQTTLPHTKVTVDDLTDWKKLSGIK
jgi:hypothetical protein